MTSTLSIAVLSAYKSEGASGAETPFTFTVTRSGDTSAAETVDWSVDDSFHGAAMTEDTIYRAWGLDFVGGALPSGTVSFDAGETSKTITVLVAGDAYSETTENFTVRLANPTGEAQIGTATALGSITNDDATFALSRNSVDFHDLREAGRSYETSMSLTMARPANSEPIALDLGYFLTTSPFSSYVGTPDLDFTHSDGTGPNGHFYFAANATSSTVTFTVVNDTIAEPTERVLIAQGSYNGVFSGITNGNLDFAIYSDDVITVSIAPQAAVTAEGSDGGGTPFTFTVTRSGDTSGATTVNYAVTGSGAHPASAADFTAGWPSGTVSFAAGEASKTVAVTVLADYTAEYDEGFTVTLSNPSGLATIAGATATGTILNDDATRLTIDAAFADGDEGTGSPHAFIYTVTRSGDLSATTSVAYTLTGAGARATDAGDFLAATPLAGTVVFAPGEASKALVFASNPDSVGEADETFQVTLSNPSGFATIANATVAGVLRDDDARGVTVTGTDGADWISMTRTVPGQPVVTDRNDTLYGLEGKDRLDGGAGADEIYGGGAGDRLNGGEGADALFGGAGSDIYWVDQAGDTVSEVEYGDDAGGDDRVISTVSFTLGDYLESLTLAGTDAIDGVGNTLGNRILGNDAANVLSGGDAADILRGGGGDDTLRGEAGADILVGGAGSDIFAVAPGAAGEVDRVGDFLSGTDRIGIAADAFGLTAGSGLTEAGGLDAEWLVSGKHAVATAAGHGQFVFDNATHLLSWDADGAGGAAGAVLVRLNSAPVAADFVVEPPAPVVEPTTEPAHAFLHSAEAFAWLP